MGVLSKIAVNADILGDILGFAAIVTILIAGIWIAHGLELPTGSDDLLAPPAPVTRPG